MSMELIAPTRGKRKKQQTFELLNGHAVRSNRDIDKERLIVPIEEYQRDESAGRIAADVAMHYDKVAFGALLVIERSNGELVVADGGTRLAGAMQRSDITTVPCTVFSGLTSKQEADVFLRMNLNRRKLQVDQQHHAELYSGETGAQKTQEFIDALHASRIGWDSLKTMRLLVKRQFLATNTIINILLQIAVDRHITARVMKGLVRLEVILQKEQRTLNKKATIKRMQDRIGNFDTAVNSVVEPRKQGDQNLFARALARTINVKFPQV